MVPVPYPISPGGQRGGLEGRGGRAGKGTVGKEGNRIEGGEHRGSSGQIVGAERVGALQKRGW